MQTQGFVRSEWAEEHGLPFFQSAEYQAALDRVCDFMGVVRGDDVRQTHRGRVLLEGSRRLGWPADVCPQNSGGKKHWCGYCHLGCGSGEKQGPAVSWLPAAAKNGAQFVEGFAVDEVLWEESEKVTGEKKKAVGVRGTWTSRDAQGGTIGPAAERTTRRVVVKAKKVIVSAGSLNSPLVLMRSGLTVSAHSLSLSPSLPAPLPPFISLFLYVLYDLLPLTPAGDYQNPHIGRNLHVHPVNFLMAFYEEDIKPWEGKQASKHSFIPQH